MGKPFTKRKRDREEASAKAKHRETCRRTRLIAVTMALTLPLLRVSRALGAEDEVGYRKSYYQEDDNRIKVSTDVWQFDVGLKDNVRVSGEVVVDAISGATPNGAPPQTKWPFPTQNSLYQSAYQSAYANQYSQFINNNQIYVDSNLETFQQLTNDAAGFAGLTAPNIATNNAGAAWQSLTNNPNYRRKSVPLTEMHDHRNAFSMQVPMTFGRHQITPSFAYSCEIDYISFGGALNYSLSLNDKNTTLNTGWAHNGDTVRDDLFNWQAKMTDDVFLGLVQLFGPKAYLTVNTSLGFEHGYLADPYRGVMLASELQNNPDDPALSPEVRPRHRDTQILYTSWTQFVTPLNGSYELSYRFFHDSYGIIANTVELDWHQKIGKYLVISPTFRYYVQNAADFYYTLVPDYNGLPSFYSSDYRLSEFESFATGVTVSWRVDKHLSLDASYMRYLMRGLDGVTSQSAYPAANVVSIGMRVWF
jgi:hypothetical protein